MDISFSKNIENQALTCIVILTYPDLNVVFEDYETVDMTIPYYPGFLAFREAPHLFNLINKIKVGSIIY